MTLELAKQLIAQKSVTPNDNGCQQIIATRLEAIGFSIEHLKFGEVDNLWARKGASAPLFVFAGHTDVVPTGPLDQWNNDPFQPTVVEKNLYGRGAADMKSSIAAMVCACETFLQKHNSHNGSIGFLITSDEEGPAVDGTVKVIEHLQQKNETINWCLIGEPTCTNLLGDVVKNGRRGSLSGTLTIHGTQGHIAYPDLADNPIHAFAPVLSHLINEVWDEGNEHFPPTRFQISNIHAGTGAGNVIPGQLAVEFNLRFSTQLDEKSIKDRIEKLIKQHNLDYSISWELSGNPFITMDGELIDATLKAIKDVCGIDAECSTAGGTSDGRFIAPLGTQVIELGPINESIHKINEHVNIDDLEQLTKVYIRVLELLLL